MIFFFSFLILSALLLNYKTSKSNFCVKLWSCKRNFVSRIFFWATPPRNPQYGAQKISFFDCSSLSDSFIFYIGRYVSEKCFDIVWEYHPTRGLQMDPPKINFLKAQARALVYFYISRCLNDKYFTMVWEGYPLKTPKMIPRKLIFCMS